MDSNPKATTRGMDLDGVSGLLLELSNLGRLYSHNRVAPPMAILGVERNVQPRCPMGGNTPSECFRRLHEHREGPQTTAHTDHECLAYTSYGISSEYGIGLFRAFGGNAAAWGIADGSGQIPMARGGHFALRPQMGRLWNGNLLARLQYRERDRIAHTTHLGTTVSRSFPFWLSDSPAPKFRVP